MWPNWFGRKKEESTPRITDESTTEGQLNVVILSDLGNIRTNNEDKGLFYRATDTDVIREKGYLLLVADGMGGHQAGEVASNLAAQTVSEEYFHSASRMSIEQSLHKAFLSANTMIYGMSSSNAEYRGMGTTCTAVILQGNSIYFGHAGDSRAYLVKDGQPTRITKDHTYVQELVNAGEITEAEAAKHPKRNILTNAMGTKPSLQVDTGKHPIEFGMEDRILLCSDGLYDYLTDDELAGILHNRPLKEAADYLVNEAKRRGGHDNITVVLAEKISVTETVSNRETRDVEVLRSADTYVTRDVELPQTKETELP